MRLLLASLALIVACTLNLLAGVSQSNKTSEDWVKELYATYKENFLSKQPEEVKPYCEKLAQASFYLIMISDQLSKVVDPASANQAAKSLPRYIAPFRKSYKRVTDMLPLPPDIVERYRESLHQVNHVAWEGATTALRHELKRLQHTGYYNSQELEKVLTQSDLVSCCGMSIHPDTASWAVAYADKEVTALAEEWMAENPGYPEEVKPYLYAKVKSYCALSKILEKILDVDCTNAANLAATDIAPYIACYTNYNQQLTGMMPVPTEMADKYRKELKQEDRMEEEMISMILAQLWKIAREDYYGSEELRSVLRESLMKALHSSCSLTGKTN